MPSEKVGSKIGCSTWWSACWISRSTTVGTPIVLTPPLDLGISTRRTARGIYRSSSSAAFTLDQCINSQSFSSSTVKRSTPGAPRFSDAGHRRMCAHAACVFSGYHRITTVRDGRYSIAPCIKNMKKVRLVNQLIYGR